MTRRYGLPLGIHSEWEENFCLSLQPGKKCLKDKWSNRCVITFSGLKR